MSLFAFHPDRDPDGGVASDPVDPGVVGVPVHRSLRDHPDLFGEWFRGLFHPGGDGVFLQVVVDVNGLTRLGSDGGVDGIGRIILEEEGTQKSDNYAEFIGNQSNYVREHVQNKGNVEDSTDTNTANVDNRSDDDSLFALF